ncbi:MAG: polysaccharide biosynthesis protein [Ekhidna sp.]|nr:polysaccharide biosynthesis protein [Ekhidna sp.]
MFSLNLGKYYWLIQQNEFQIKIIHLKEKSVIIIGGTGTLGRAVVKEIIETCKDVGRVVVFSRDEIKQLEMMDDYPATQYPFLHYKLGDVRDLARLQEVVKGADYIIHAAAIKHVVMAEKNPDECWKTNVKGTENVIQAAKQSGVKRTLLISTDKAVNPAGIYGKSKLQAEELFKQAGDNFGIVRLGNIIGSRGSVFEAFEKQRKSGVIKVTHPEATRFCISPAAAASFVLASLMSPGVSVSAPEMESFKVIDLAKQMAPECSIEIVGLRPGDKLHEELDGVSSADAELIDLK